MRLKVCPAGKVRVATGFLNNDTGQQNLQKLKALAMIMKRTALALVLVVLATPPVQAKIYRWVDENGSVHFSDKPYSEKAQEIIIQETGIELEETPAAATDEPPSATPADPEESPAASKQRAVKTEPAEIKVITEEDYKITTTIGKLGLDLISISGRIGNGPKCYDLSVVVTATNENGLSATISDQVRKSSSFGSVTFNGTAKATGSAEDRGFWKVDSVTVRCNDPEP